MINRKSITRIAALATTVLIVGTAIAEAKDSGAQKAQDDCMSRAAKNYNTVLNHCIEKYSGADLNQCITEATGLYATATKNCMEKYPAFTPIDPGVGGANATSFDGWHPKGPKTKGLTSGKPLSVDGGSDGGGKGGHSNPFQGTFNSSMGGGKMSTGSGGAIVQ